MIPEWLLIPDPAALVFFVVGSGAFATWSIIFTVYRFKEGGDARHVMVAVACALLSFHQATLAVRNFRYWFSVMDTIILTRLALAVLVILVTGGLPSHLLYRWWVRNE